MLPAIFRGVPFAITGGWTFGFDQGHAAHLYPDRDGGFIESTGRNPSHFQFTAGFRQGIGGEGTDILFPTRWLKFVAACADRTTGTLQHPVLGNLKVKCVKQQSVFDVQRRDGVDVEVEFVETTDAEDELSKLLAGASPMATAISAAGDLDAAVADISPPPTRPDFVDPSAQEMLKGLSGTLNQFKRGIGNISTAIDSNLGALDEFAQNIAKSKDDPGIAKALRALNRCFDAVVQVGQTATSSGKQITQAVVANDATIDAVAAFFAMGQDDFARLNPRACLTVKIPKGTRVFVFAA